MAEEAAIAFIDGRFLHKGKEYDSKAAEEIVAVHNFEGPVARIRRGYGLTMNLTNYESARFDVILELPCYVEDIDKADEFAKRWVEQRCEAEVAEVRAPNGGGASKPGY
ncbi:MAG: hypothetical protein JRG69_03385 [Deltaproteobacteria bacterium]|nr:hypothetical protein [Deltaproteobacteria bacterium]